MLSSAGREKKCGKVTRAEVVLWIQSAAWKTCVVNGRHFVVEREGYKEERCG